MDPLHLPRETFRTVSDVLIETGCRVSRAVEYGAGGNTMFEGDMNFSRCSLMIPEAKFWMVVKTELTLTLTPRYINGAVV